MKTNLLFVTPKWCDGLPEFGFNNDFHNLLNTLAQSKPDILIHALHPDECTLLYKRNIDDIIKTYVSENHISIIIYCLINGRDYNPSIKCMRDLKPSVKECVIWPDTGPSWGMQTIQEIGDSVHLHVSEDFPKGPYHETFPARTDHMMLWTPEDPCYFYYEENKDIDVSFIGSVNMYRDRMTLLEQLKGRLNLFISGGQRTTKLSPYEYAELIRRSKIGLNFAMSQTGVFWQAKGRIFEYAACGTLFLDMPNPSTRHFFRPNIDYVEYYNAVDIIDKVTYYLANTEERLNIVKSAYKRYTEFWTAKSYWDLLITKLEEQHEI